jgi:hypothetical protein
MQQQHLFYRRNVVVAVLVVAFGQTDRDQQHCYHHVPTVKQMLLLHLIDS